MTVSLALLLAVQTPEPILSRDISITIPGPLNGAIAPYMRCTVEALNSGLQAYGGGPEVHSQLRSHVVTTCAKMRGKAIKAADAIMQSEAHHINPRERRDIINSIFKNVDSLHETATKFADASNADDRMPIAPSSAPAFEVRREQNSLELPREIAPALVPYFKCTMETMNTYGPTSTGAEYRIKKQRAIASCSQSRAEAKAAALHMLSRADTAANDRDSFVERALSSIDHAGDGAADRLDAANANHSPQD